MKRSTRRLILSTFFLVLFCSVVSAQRNPGMVEQQRDNEREELYAKFNENRRIKEPEHHRLAYEYGKEYLRKFGGENDRTVKEVRRFVEDYESAGKERQLTVAYNAKNYVKVFEIGRPLLESAPGDFSVLGTLVEAGYENALAGNTSMNEETVRYATRAIQLLENGKVTNPDPFKSIDVANGYLNFVLGWLLKDQSPTNAAQAFHKAVQTENPYRSDPLTYRMLGGTLLKGEFTQLSAEYNEKFGNKPPSPEQEAMLARINSVGARAIDAYARAVALSTSPTQQEPKAKMLAQLTALYKSFHNNSDEGLNELIANVLTKPVP